MGINLYGLLNVITKKSAYTLVGDMQTSALWGSRLEPYRKAMVRPAMTILTIDMSLMRMLSDGPDVSLNGSDRKSVV